MIRLSAFADEISPDLNEQIGALHAEGIRHVELRSVWDTNVLDLTDTQVAAIKRDLGAAGISVSAIGSPLGKSPLDEPFDRRLDRLDRALALAHAFDTTVVRVFSFYPPVDSPGTDPAFFRDEAVARLREMTVRARVAGVTLLHENEKGIYGDTIAHCVDLLRSVDDEGLRAVLDPANFIQCHQTPYPDGYEALRPWLAAVHVKDADAGGTVVAAGEGVARWPELLERLRDDGYGGFFALEPHLAAAGPLGGFSGADLFRHASQSFQRLLRAMGWEYG